MPLYTPGVVTLAGTVNQVVVSAPQGAVTLSLPQNIDTAATLRFARLGLGQAADVAFPLAITGSGTSGGLQVTSGSGVVGYLTPAGNVNLQLGTTSNHPLQFFTNNINRWFITAAGTLTATAVDNTTQLSVIGGSITGANAISALTVAQTWNGTGSSDLVLLNPTNTASGANTNVIRFKLGSGNSPFMVSKDGGILAGIVIDSGNVPRPAAAFHAADNISASTKTMLVVSRGNQGGNAMPQTYGVPYAMIGGLEFPTNGVGALRTIGFGYGGGGLSGFGVLSGKPYAEFGTIDTSVVGNSKGDFIWALRDVTTDTAASQVMRLTSTGVLQVGYGVTTDGSVAIFNATTGTGAKGLLLTSAGAYAAVLNYDNTPLDLYTNSTIKWTIAANGGLFASGVSGAGKGGNTINVQQYHGDLYSLRATGGVASTGGVTAGDRIMRSYTGIADNTATATITVTIPNAAHSATVRTTLSGALGAGGAIGALEAMGNITYDIAVARTVGVATVATASAGYGSSTASVAGAATITITAAVSAMTGGVGATQTFTVNVTIARGSGLSTNHTCLVSAEVINHAASGVTVS